MKKIIILIASLASVWGAQGQTSDPSVVYVGTKLPARTYIVPFANDAELKSGTSSLVIKVADWEQKQSEQGTTFTATFKRPSDWNSRGVIVRIAGASSSFSLYVNGEWVGYSQWGTGRAEFDITKYTKEFYNTLSINILRGSMAEQLEVLRPHDNVGFESVEVVSQPAVRVEDIIVNARAEGGRGILGLQLAMKNTTLNPRNLTLQYELTAPDGKVVAKEVRILNIGASKSDTISFSYPTLDKIERWTAVSPKLYTLTIRSLYNTHPTEIIVRKIGFTDYSVAADGKFMVAGKAVPLVAVRMSWKGSVEATEAEMRRVKNQKANAIWVDGAPQRDEFYAIADRLGMYVIDHADIATGMAYPNASNEPAFVDTFSERILGAYHYSRIHPSVIAWFSVRDTANGYCMSESYLRYKQIEKRRPLIYIGSDGSWASDAIIVSVMQ